MLLLGTTNFNQSFLTKKAYQFIFLLFQILAGFWKISPCGPYHMLKEILFCKKRKWKLSTLGGIRKSIERQGYRGPESACKKITCCPRNSHED